MWSVRLLSEHDRSIRELSLGVDCRENRCFLLSNRGLHEGDREGRDAHRAARGARGQPLCGLSGVRPDAARRACQLFDDRGAWHQAFLMPEDMTLEDILEMDIQAQEAALAHDLIYAAPQDTDIRRTLCGESTHLQH